MSFTKAEMLYHDGDYYKWEAAADHDNPYYIKGTDHSELNRTEGYEILYFINHVGIKRWSKDAPANLGSYQTMERMIRYDVPNEIKTHKKIEDWLIANWAALK